MRQDVERTIRPRPSEDVTASEIAAHAYCAKSWHLERVLGVQASAQAAQRRSNGVAGHEDYGAAVRAGSLLGLNGRSLILALLALAALFALLATAIR